jgi:hypothetical protein
MIKSVEKVIEALGGPTKTAAVVGLDFPSAIVNWRTRREIPPEYFLLICAAVDATGKGPIDRSVFGFKVEKARA